MNALASDLDGTLIFKEIEGGFKQDDINSVKEYQRLGCLFGLCTGRPYSGVVRGTIDFDFYVVSSGALIVDRDGNTIYEKSINYETMRSIYRDYNDVVHVYIQADRKMFTTKKGRFPIEQTLFKNIEELVDHSIQGVSMDAMTEENACKVAHSINEKYGEHVEAFQNVRCVDVVKKGCSKGAALTFFKNMMNIEEMSGIGDSFNDVPMLEHVDFGFTFPYAPQEVKKHADYLVESVSEAITILMKK